MRLIQLLKSQMDINILSLLLFVLITSSLLFNLNHRPNIPDRQLQYQYQKWKRQFSVDFSEDEDHFRFEIFSLNVHKIHAHNQLPTKSYSLGLNQFAHLTQFEFTELFLQKTPNQNLNLRLQTFQISFINLKNLTDIDWQSLGKVSEVKNQGYCNSGYAFSIISLIQSSLLMQNQNILLSQQQIIDCAGDHGAKGCDGGQRDGVLLYSFQKGLNTQSRYPYTGIKGTCKLQSGTIFPDFSPKISLGCEQLKQNLYKSPIAVAVNAKNWQLYNTGIFNNCPITSEVNHEIFLVGVTLTYWRLKNSWGLRWGEYGYIRIKLGNSCGICERPGYGFIL